MKKHVTIYTDGACSGNPGAGGYAAILMYNGVEKIVSGAEMDTTNNRMELVAAIKGLIALKESYIVSLYSDSQYLTDAFNKDWLKSWAANNWRTTDKKPVKNVDLWQELLSLSKKHCITFIKVKGHSDNEFNNRCDKIAVEEYKRLQNSDTMG